MQNNVNRDTANTNLIAKENLLERLLIESGCALCSMVMDYEFNFLAQLQNKIANDEHTRLKIAGQGGFCDYHFSQLKRIASGKTLIVLLKTIIEVCYYKKDNYEINCSICNFVNEYEDELIKKFASVLQDERNIKKLESTNGICSVHLNQLDKIIDDKNTINRLYKNYIEQIERMETDFE